MNIKKSWPLIVIIVSYFIAAGYCTYINISTYKFFDINFMDIIGFGFQLFNILLMYFIYITFAKHFTNEQKQKQIFEEQLLKLETLIEKDVLLKFNTSSDWKAVQLEIRKIRNLITVLKELSKLFKLEGNIQYIEEEFQKYQDIVEGAQNKLSTLALREVELRRPMGNIEQKCTFSRLSLYNIN